MTKEDEAIQKENWDRLIKIINMQAESIKLLKEDFERFKMEMRLFIIKGDKK